MIIEVNRLEDLEKVSNYILEEYPEEKIIVFDAEMGMGKTTFIKHFCEEKLNTEDEVSSPTFAIVNVYKYNKSEAYHFDFYRLDSIEEALDIGFDEYIYSGNYCFIEWPDIIENFLPDNYLKIKITQEKDSEKRYFEILKV